MFRNKKNATKQKRPLTDDKVKYDFKTYFSFIIYKMSKISENKFSTKPVCVKTGPAEVIRYKPDRLFYYFSL